MLRRRFHAALAAALASLAVRTNAAAAPVDVVRQMADLARALRSEGGDPQRWAAEMETIFESIDLAELTRRIDFDRVAEAMALPDDRAGVVRLRLPVVEASGTGMIVKVFGLRRGRALVPHAHNDMVSMHLVVDGEIEGRHYDRVVDETNHLVVRPSGHELYGPGGASLVTPGHDNAHWFEARTQTAFAFGVAIAGLHSAQPPSRTRVFLDPLRASPVAGDLLRMPIISARAGFARYGFRK